MRPTAKEGEEESSITGWLALSGTVVIYIIVLLLLSGGTFVNVGESLAHINAGKIALDQFDTETSMREYRVAADLWPESVTGHVSLAVAYVAAEDFDSALAELNIAQQSDPRSLPVAYFLSLNYVARGEFDLAIEKLESLKSVQPLWGLPHASLAVIYYQTDQLDLSERELQEALRVGMNDPQVLWFISGYYSSTQDFENAEFYIRKAMELSDDPTYSLYLASILVSQKQFDAAQEAIDSVSYLNVSPAFLGSIRANLAAAQQDLKGAEAELLHVLEHSPRNGRALSDLSFVYFQMGRVSEATSIADQALEINLYNQVAYVERAFAYHAQGKISEAQESAKRGVALNPKYDRAHFILGLCYMDSGKKADAIREFEIFLDLYWDRAYVTQYKAQAEEFLSELR